VGVRGQIERDDRASARALLEAQTNVRLLERLLTLRVVKEQYAAAIAAMEDGHSPNETGEADEIDEPDEE